MKFSLIIPTQDRPKLLAIAVDHAMQSEHPNFEVIVSDNSTTDELRAQTFDAVRGFEDSPNFNLVHPPRVLSPPEHFEFALQFATGDYVVYLTDKMVMLPHTLADAEAAIRKFGADIVNWASEAYYIDDGRNPSGSGSLVEEFEYLGGTPNSYDPIAALQFKASCAVPRSNQSTRDYALGKIVFGCYSKNLIDRILSKSGAVFGGATHDYSAMIQALSLARTCVFLNTYGVLFISLPPDQSLGSLTAMDPQRALQYYRSFTEADSILSSLLVPGVYASQHNMVAHDYKKFLPMYGNEDLFSVTNWLWSIYSDLTSESMVWRDPEEVEAQIGLFMHQVDILGQRFPLRIERMKVCLAAMFDSIMQSKAVQIPKVVLSDLPEPRFQTLTTSSLNDALRHVSSQRLVPDIPDTGRS